MSATDWRDLTGGAVLVVAGLAYAAHSALSYDAGSLRSIGPGLFPTAAGGLLAMLGAAISINALIDRPALVRRAQHLPLRVPATILLAVAVFALSIERFGLLPSTLAVVAISALASRLSRARGVVLLALVLMALVAAIFKFGLGLLVPLFDWQP